MMESATVRMTAGPGWVVCPPAPDESHGEGVSAMAMRRLRLYTEPEGDTVALATLPHPQAGVRVALGEVLPLLADAVASDRTWLKDFVDEEITVSADLYDVLQAYRHFRRPGA